uniref:Cytochrome c oxidase subunit 2 n=1 Tax=Gari togata TaxID=2774046 RepID=A0A8K1DU47_9BIVA|nr:cytochrome c oxidase subunit II [Gari togata]
MFISFFIMSVVFSSFLFFLPKWGVMYTRGMFRNVNKNVKLEFWWTVIPMIILLFIGYPSFGELYSSGMNDKDKFMSLKVTGHQWYWDYEYSVNIQGLMEAMEQYGVMDKALAEVTIKSYLYSDENTCSNCCSVLGGDLELKFLKSQMSQKNLIFSSKDWVVKYSSYTIQPGPDLSAGFKYGRHVDFPAVLAGDCEVEILVTSADVVHCWTVMGLGIKVDAVPGRINAVHLSNIRPGYTSWGGCSEMCGVNHWQMVAEVEVLSKRDFLLWLFSMVYFELKELNSQ